MKPMEVEILVAEVGDDAGRRPAVPHPLRRHRHGRGALQRARRRGRGHRRAARGGLQEPAATSTTALRGGGQRPGRARPPAGAPTTSRWPCSTRGNGRRAFRRIERRRASPTPCGAEVTPRPSRRRRNRPTRRPRRADAEEPRLNPTIGGTATDRRDAADRHLGMGRSTGRGRAGHGQQQDHGQRTAAPPGALRRRRARRPGSASLVDDDLAGAVEVVLVDQHVDRPEGVGAVDVAAQLATRCPRRRARAARTRRLEGVARGERTIGRPPPHAVRVHAGRPAASGAAVADGPLRTERTAGSVRPMERRIFGLENEYGVTCTLRGQRRLSPDEVARYLFRRVVSWGRSSNVFLANGARLYLDVGQPPRVRHARVRLDPRPGRSTTRRGSASSSSCWPPPSSACGRRASAASSTCSRTTPTRPATPTAATRTT